MSVLDGDEKRALRDVEKFPNDAADRLADPTDPARVGTPGGRFAAPAPDPRRMPVLVVDDVPLIRTVVRAVLEQTGVRDVHEAPDGVAALAMLSTHAYGLVISDLHMDPMSGFELLRRVRDDRRLRETLFVMMTTKEHAHAFTAVRRAGVNACLVKPFMPADLRRTLAEVWPP